MIGIPYVTVLSNPYALDYVQVAPPPVLSAWPQDPTYWRWDGDHWTAIKLSPTNNAQLIYPAPTVFSHLPPGPVFRLTADMAFDALPTSVQLGVSVRDTDSRTWSRSVALAVTAGRKSYTADVPWPAGAPTDFSKVVSVGASIQSVGFTPNQWRVYDATLAIRSTGGTSADLTCYIDQVSIQHGRDDTTAQPDASTVTVDVSWDGATQALPATVEIGAVLLVDVEYPPGSGTRYRRFAGRITDLELEWTDAGPETPDAATGRIMGASTMADLGRRIVGDTPWPQELDGSRESRILQLAGITLDANTSDPGTVQILARDVDAQPALDLAQQVASDAGGLLWETAAGQIRYADSEHRRGTTSKLTLDACDLLVTPRWQRDTNGLINAVSIGYGVPPEGGEQPRYVNENPTSKDRWGRYGLSSTTQLAAQADAEAMGRLLLARNGSPVWVLTGLPVDLQHLDAARTAALLALDLNDLVGLTGLPTIGQAPTTAALWLEGWTEVLEPGDHAITLAVSGYCRTAPAPRWDDVDPAWTWDTIRPASLTWDDATCLGPTVDQGRWNDVPASRRWDQIPATVTWDTYEAWIGA